MKVTSMELLKLTPEEAAKVTHVEGDLFLDKGLPLPSLTHVARHLYLTENTPPLPSLTHVGGHLDLNVYPHTLPSLTHIGGYTYDPDFKQLKEILRISRDSEDNWEVTYTSAQMPQCAKLRTWFHGDDFTDEVAVYKYLMEQKE